MKERQKYQSPSLYQTRQICALMIKKPGTSPFSKHQSIDNGLSERHSQWNRTLECIQRHHQSRSKSHGKNLHAEGDARFGCIVTRHQQKSPVETITEQASGCTTNRSNGPATLAFVHSKASSKSRVKHLTPFQIG